MNFNTASPVTFQEFILSEDYNKMTPAHTYQGELACMFVCLFVCACMSLTRMLFVAHQGRVTVVLFVLEMEWLLSTGQDKTFTWHCSESGQQLGSYHTSAWVSGLQYPAPPLSSSDSLTA